MKNLILLCVLLGCAGGLVPGAQAADTTEQPQILNYLVSRAPEYQTFVKVLNASELSATLSGGGSYTVFAPVNAAFTDLPYGGPDSLLQPGYIDSLQDIVAYHIVAGTYDPDQLRLQIRQHGGSLSLPTIGEGGSIDFFLKGDTVFLRSKNGVEQALSEPVTCANGLVYSLTELLSP